MDLYEEKYNAALERAKKLQETCDSTAVLGWCEYIFPELKESEDNDVRKAIIALIEFGLEDGSAIVPGYNVTKEKAITWLEKQADKDKLIHELGEHKVKYTQKVLQEDLNKNIKSQSLPKFKVGDWIIGNEYGEVLKVTKADANSYEITTQDGEVLDILKEDVECNYRLWTIADAKDGDVLVAQPEIGSESNEQIFLFKAINSRDYVDNCIEYYGRLCDDRFYKNKTGYMGTTLDTFYPATKEQSDLLFQKMADAGYEFVNGHI